MSEIVVNLFQPIHVDTGDSDRKIRFFTVREEFCDLLLETAAVQKSGQRIPDIQILDVVYLKKLIV